MARSLNDYPVGPNGKPRASVRLTAGQTRGLKTAAEQVTKHIEDCADIWQHATEDQRNQMRQASPLLDWFLTLAERFG